jgi:hypothetical protein
VGHNQDPALRPTIIYYYETVCYNTDNSGINLGAVYYPHLRLLFVTITKSAIFCYQLISNIYNDITASENNHPVGYDAVYSGKCLPSFGGETCFHLQGKRVISLSRIEYPEN